MTGLPEDLWAQCQLRAQVVATSLRLPFRRRTWRGLNGNWQGTGTGSSLDFQDHRPYIPGDDPRYINWQAFARNGHYTMKLYRQEVSPALDLLIDCSASMFNDPAKAARVAELVYWSVESALSNGANLRCYRWDADQAEPLPTESILSHRWVPTTPTGPASAILPDLPWRHGSLRVLISDLLWPGDGSSFLQRLTEGQGAAVILAPFSPDEATPDWSGNLEMIDCESQQVRHQRTDLGLLKRYQNAYQQHFALWQSLALRYQVPLARIAAIEDLAEALRIHSGEGGAVEWAH